MAPKVTKTVTEATCEKGGKITYTATSKFDGKTYTDTKTVTTPATGHNWKAQSWNWNDDNTKATVSIVCKNNPNETKTLEATVTKMELEPATCTGEGKVQYTAKVANPDKPGSTFVTFKTVKTPIDPNGHAFDADENK